MLLDNDADVNAKNNLGQTPLHMTCVNGYKEVVELLIDKGAEVNSNNNSGRTSLNIATQIGHTEIEALLREHGAESSGIEMAPLRGAIGGMRRGGTGATNN